MTEMLIFKLLQENKILKKIDMVIDGQEMAFKMDDKVYHCALDVTMSFIGGKWKTVILWYLRKQPQRFSALKKLIPQITEKMLSLQLKELEKDGLIHREVFAEVPPRVEYSYTALGATLIPTIEMMAAWGRTLAGERGCLIAMSEHKK
jgi:DNA-binding HxlR family transcriptional regulator